MGCGHTEKEPTQLTYCHETLSIKKKNKMPTPGILNGFLIQ